MNPVDVSQTVPTKRQKVSLLDVTSTSRNLVTEIREPCLIPISIRGAVSHFMSATKYGMSYHYEADSHVQLNAGSVLMTPSWLVAHLEFCGFEATLTNLTSELDQYGRVSERAYHKPVRTVAKHFPGYTQWRHLLEDLVGGRGPIESAYEIESRFKETVCRVARKRGLDVIIVIRNDKVKSVTDVRIAGRGKDPLP